jgi:hypothetical protein
MICFKNIFKNILFHFFLVNIVLLIYSIPSLPQETSFLKPYYYDKNVCIQNPESSLLAELFLRAGINVDSYKKSWCKDPKSSLFIRAFTFKTLEKEDKFIVLIYYGGDYVGRYVYTKKNNPRDIEEFSYSFVKWMLKNAWEKEF